MCGICGWVDFRRDLRGQAERQTLEAMVATMACRGPDAEGTWIDRPVALGHRRLSVIDCEGGRQPMTVDEDDRTLAVMTYSGEVYNYRELRAELSGRGHRFRTRSDTEVVLHAYLEWGEQFVERLNGMYAFAVWDATTNHLLLVRDRMGIKPLYYAPTEHGLLFGSEPKAILANPLLEPAVDLDGLREILAFVKTPGHAVYRGMKELPPGCTLSVRRDGLRLRRYWGLEALEHTDDVDTTVATVRGLLEDIVNRQLISDVPLCTLLSGGLDSSAVTALAAQRLREQGRGAVRSFAVDFVGYSDRFTADAMRDAPDAPFVHEVAAHVESSHADIVLSTEQLMDPAHRGAVLRANDLPLGGDMFTSLYLLFAEIRAHSTVALSGESADEVFGGYRWFHDEAAMADTFPWLAAQGRFMGHETERQHTLFTPELLGALDVPGYQRDAYATALAEVPHLDTASRTERRMREVCYLHLTRFVQFLLDRKDRMSMASGLEVRVPFCDHRLVQYVFNTPWRLKTFDGREKSLLRAATGDLLPQSVLERRKSPYPSTQDPGYEAALRAQLREILAAGSSPVLELLDRERARKVLDADVGAVSLDASCRAIELTVTLHEWLTSSGARLDFGSASGAEADGHATRRRSLPVRADCPGPRSIRLGSCQGEPQRKEDTMVQPTQRTTSRRSPRSLGSYEDREWNINTGVGFTALAVAAGRAMESARDDRLISDPYAAAFVDAAHVAMPLPTEWPPEGQAGPGGGAGTDAATSLWRGMASYMGVRSRFFDEALASAARDGVRQVVLLAAGLDTRAYRLDWPASTQLFELDHANVLDFKDQVLGGRDAAPRCTRHAIGVDLRDDWPAALIGAGLQPDQPTAWLAEGLLFFLPDDAKRLLVERVHALSAPGSRWAIESMMDPAAAMQAMQRDTLIQEAATVFGSDPSRLWPQEQRWEPHDWLVAHGWSVSEASAHTVAARHERVLDGHFPLARHPSVLLEAHCEHPIDPDCQAAAPTLKAA